MSSEEATVPVFTHALAPVLEVTARATELQIVEVTRKPPPRRQVVLHCRTLCACRRHFVRRERCSYRRRPSALPAPPA
jgi:hypothetical protein